MNLANLFQLIPLSDDIQKAVAVAEKYMNDPETVKAISLVEQIEADPAVKAAIATAKKVADILSAQGTTS